jgi:hypothetical protein
MRRSFVWLAFAATALLLLLIFQDTTGVSRRTELQLASGTAGFRFSGPGLPLAREEVAGKEVAVARELVELVPLAIKPASKSPALAAVWLDRPLSPRMPELESAKPWNPNLELQSLQPLKEPKIYPQMDNGFDLELKFAVKPVEPEISVGYQGPPSLDNLSPKIALATALDPVLSNPGQLLEKTPKLMPNSPWHMPSMWAYPTCITSLKDGLPNGPVDSF